MVDSHENWRLLNHNALKGNAVLNENKASHSADCKRSDVLLPYRDCQALLNLLVECQLRLGIVKRACLCYRLA